MCSSDLSLVPGFGQNEPDSSMFLFTPNERQFAHLAWINDKATSLYDTSEYHLAWQRIKDHRINSDFNSDDINTEQNESALLNLQSSFKKKINSTTSVGAL